MHNNIFNKVFQIMAVFITALSLCGCTKDTVIGFEGGEMAEEVIDAAIPDTEGNTEPNDAAEEDPANICVFVCGAVMNPGAEPGAAIIREEELKAACDMAAFVNRPVSVHCHGSEGIKMCIRCGVRTIEHSSIMDDECIRMYTGTDQSFMIPTLSAPFSFVEFPHLVPSFMTEKAKKVVDLLTEGMIAAREAGIKMGWGTDAGVYEGSHGNGIYEHRLRVNKIGFTPLECLIQATKNNSEILCIDDKVGTVAAGKQADLIVIDGRPDEDIEDITKVDAVFKKGMLVRV